MIRVGELEQINVARHAIRRAVEYDRRPMLGMEYELRIRPGVDRQTGAFARYSQHYLSTKQTGSECEKCGSRQCGREEPVYSRCKWFHKVTLLSRSYATTGPKLAHRPQE